VRKKYISISRRRDFPLAERQRKLNCGLAILLARNFISLRAARYIVGDKYVSRVTIISIPRDCSADERPVFARLSSPCYFSSSCQASCIRDGVFFYARLKNQRRYGARLAELPRQKQLAVNCRQIRILSSSIPSFSTEISKSLRTDLDELTMRVPRIENNLKHISPFGVEASVVFISLGRARTRLRTCNHVRNIYQREQALVNRGFIRLNDDRSKSSYDAHYVFPRAYIRARAHLSPLAE